MCLQPCGFLSFFEHTPRCCSLFNLPTSIGKDFYASFYFGVYILLFLVLSLVLVVVSFDERSGDQLRCPDSGVTGEIKREKPEVSPVGYHYTKYRQERVHLEIFSRNPLGSFLTAIVLWDSS